MKRTRNHSVKSGDTFGMLTIIKEISPHINKCRQYRMVSCVCKCGNKVDIRLASITCGQTISCGCLRVEFAKTLAKPIHGLCTHPLYSVWEGMIQRCHNKNCQSFKHYGAKGVCVCDEWRNNFKSFYDWCIENGWEEGLEIDKDKLSLDKPGKLYSPEFCCFLTPKENMRFRVNTKQVLYKGRVHPFSEACEIANVGYNIVSARMKLGFSFEDSISENYRSPYGKKIVNANVE